MVRDAKSISASFGRKGRGRICAPRCKNSVWTRMHHPPMSTHPRSLFLPVVLLGAILLSPEHSSAAGEAIASTCVEIEGRLRSASASFGDALPVPDFVADRDWPASRTTRTVPSVEVHLRCDNGRFQSYEAFISGGNTATLARWTLWSQASLIATDTRLNPERAFRFIQRLQKLAIEESLREEIKSGDRSGCSRLKSGPFEFEYGVQPGQVRVAFRPSQDENDSCKLLR